MKNDRKLNKKHFLIGLSGVAIVLIGLFIAFYGFGRLSREDCTKYEQYDALRGECYFECETDDQCEEIAKKVEAELNAFFEGSQSKISTNKPTSPEATEPTDTATPDDTTVEQATNEKTYTAEDTGSETGGRIYAVSKGQTLYPTPSAEDQELWELFIRIASRKTIAERLETFEVFNDESNDSAASVWESSVAGKWHMNVNAAFATDRKDLIHTMVHEFGHIYTLNVSQVEKTEGACPIITVPEGCVRSGTLLADFYAKFWEEYGERAGGSDSESPVAEYDESSFVSEYAASNMIEDLAETFAYFVLRPAPNGSKIVDQKIQLLYDRQELVNLRNRIRASLASEL